MPPTAPHCPKGASKALSMYGVPRPTRPLVLVPIACPRCFDALGVPRVKYTYDTLHMMAKASFASAARNPAISHYQYPLLPLPSLPPAYPLLHQA